MYITATELKNNLGKYLTLVSSEDIYITKNGRVVSKLTSPIERKICDGTAVLSSAGNLTSFTFNNQTIRFKTSDKLERYTEVKEWDNGYIVVMAKYSNSLKEEEEYIDLVPILENLYFDTNEFLQPIEQVRIVYE